MPPLIQARVTKSKPPPSFFAPRARRDLIRQDYNSIQRREVVPANPERDPSPPHSSTASTTLEDDDTIVVDPKAPMEDDLAESKIGLICRKLSKDGRSMTSISVECYVRYDSAIS